MKLPTLGLPSSVKERYQKVMGSINYEVASLNKESKIQNERLEKLSTLRLIKRHQCQQSRTLRKSPLQNLMAMARNINLTLQSQRGVLDHCSSVTPTALFCKAPGIPAWLLQRTLKILGSYSKPKERVKCVTNSANKWSMQGLNSASSALIVYV